MCNQDNNHPNNLNEKNNKQHDHEHRSWSRRAFMQALGLTGAGAITLSNNIVSASASSSLAVAIDESPSDRVLVIIRLKGGNDGLNTIVPTYDYDTYANLRPNIKIEENSLLPLDDNFGVANYMQGVKNLWDDGKMRIVHGVGYDNHSLSHFLGSDNWATADVENQIETTGWMGRYFEEIYPDFLFSPPEKPAAIQVGNQGNLIFDGDETSYAMAVANPQQLYQIASQGVVFSLDNIADTFHGSQSEYLRGLANTTLNYAEVINTAFESVPEGTGYTDGDLSEQLQIVARLVRGNLGTKVFFVSLGGFDTHSNQPVRHEALMTELSGALEAFYTDLDTAGWGDKVLSMTISEFGRRTAQNGSNGTDHGAASQIMLFSSGLEGNGFISSHPDLSDLDNTGNLKYNLDFRQVYASVLTDWLCVDAAAVNEALLGQNFEALPLGYTCASLGTEELLPGQRFTHNALYRDNQVFIRYVLRENMHVDIKLYTMSGQLVKTLSNQFMATGEHIVNVSSNKGELKSGSYIYRIATRGGYYSKILMIP